jgi:hypothetical protein
MILVAREYVKAKEGNAKDVLEGRVGYSQRGY